jgi:hypothetical protein
MHSWSLLTASSWKRCGGRRREVTPFLSSGTSSARLVEAMRLLYHPWFIALFALLLCAVSLLEFLNFTGFCYSQQRYLTDDDFFLAAKKRTLDSLKIYPGQIVYDSVEALDRANPRCCKIDREGGDPQESWARAFGWHVVDVEVRIKANDQLDKPYYRTTVSLSSCGRVLASFSNFESDYHRYD